MKYFILLLLLLRLSVDVYADQVFTNKQKNYNQAKELFKNKKYQKSYDIFYALFENDLKNPNINFYLGRNAYMLKQFDTAISAYERVLIIDSKSIRSKLEIARCYFELKNYKKSQIIFLETIKENLPTNVKQNINMYLNAINSKTKKNFFTGSLVFGINYDTNIYNRANDDIFTIPGIIDSVTNQAIDANNSTEEASGFSNQEAISFNHLYRLNDNMNIKNDFILFNKSFFEHHDKDIALIQYSPALSVVYNGNILVDYAFLFNKIWLSSEPYLTNYGIYPKIKYIYSHSSILSSSFKYLKKSTDLASSDILALEFNLRHLYSEKLSFLFYSQLYSERKTDTELTNIDHDMLNISFSTSYKYTQTFTISPKIQWYNKSYKDEDVFYLKNQEDNEYKLSINTTYAYNKNLLLNFDYIYTKHTSNIPSWDFNKQSITTNVILIF